MTGFPIAEFNIVRHKHHSKRKVELKVELQQSVFILYVWNMDIHSLIDEFHCIFDDRTDDDLFSG
jgi:hypothetical protein